MRGIRQAVRKLLAVGGFAFGAMLGAVLGSVDSANWVRTDAGVEIACLALGAVLAQMVYRGLGARWATDATARAAVPTGRPAGSARPSP